MSLRSRLRLFAEPVPSDCINVKVEIGPDVLELAVSRRDISPALERELRDEMRADPDFNGDSDEMSLPMMESIAKRSAMAVKAYRIYPVGTPEADIEKVEFATDLTDRDLLELGPYFWPINTAIWDALNPGNPPGVAE